MRINVLRIPTLHLVLPALVVTALLTATPSQTHAASKTEIDARVAAALTKLYDSHPAAKSLMQKAAGVLIFPRIFKGGFGIGVEYGEGALIVNDTTVDYYKVAAASAGLQLGGQAKTEVVMFMTNDALNNFRQSDGWEAGVDGSVALLTVGVGGEFDTHNIQDPIIGFVYGNKGLMYDLSFEGTKFWRTKK